MGIVGHVATRQSREFGTGRLELWPDGQPKWLVVITLTVEPEDEDDTGDRRLYVRPGSNLAWAIRQAVEAAGASQIEVGSQLTVTYVGDEEPASPDVSGAKVYEAEYKASRPRPKVRVRK
jgi:hypothetical protein